MMNIYRAPTLQLNVLNNKNNRAHMMYLETEIVNDGHINRDLNLACRM